MRVPYPMRLPRRREQRLPLLARIHIPMRILHIGEPVRTNIEIDDELMRKALASTGSKTKREVVETALKLLVQMRAQEGLRSLKGLLKDDGWEGDLHEMRLTRFPDDGDKQ